MGCICGNTSFSRPPWRYIRLQSLVSAGSSPLDQGLEQAFVQSAGSWNGCSGKHCAVKPAAEQAVDDNGCAQHGCRNRRTRSGKPRHETLMAAEPGNDPRVDGVIEPVRLGLVCE